MHIFSPVSSFQQGWGGCVCMLKMSSPYEQFIQDDV